MAARRTGDCSTTRRAGLTRKEIPTKYVLLNPHIWLLSFCYVLVYGPGGDKRWGNFICPETLGVDLVTANTAVTMFELGGFIGALGSGLGFGQTVLTATAGR